MSVGYPWISDAKEKNDVLHRPRNYPTWQGIAGHFTITGKLGEKPTCVHLLRHKTYSVELASVHFEVELH